MNAICDDGRFELIAKAREELIESTNIEDSQEEMAVLDNILFRCWQMGWLNHLRDSGDIRAKNAKLRELLNELLMIGSFNGSCRRDCRYGDDCLADRFGQPDCFVCQELQELGIEAVE